MPSTTTGHAATVQSVLPTVKNISSTTHATPIVVTTTAAHGLNTGDYFTVAGATDPNANGDWRAGTVTSTTVVLTVAPTGANSVGTLVGGAVGTLQGRQFGAAITIPSGGDKPSAASVIIPVEALADQTAWLAYSRLNRLGDTTGGTINFGFDTNFLANTTNTLKANATFETQPLSTIIASGDISVQSGATLSMDSASVAALLGRTRRRAIVYKTDSSYTLDRNTGGNQIVMLTAPAANRIVTLRQSTAPVPQDGDWFEVTALLGTSGFTIGLQREGSLNYVAVLGDGASGTPYSSSNQVATATVQLQAGVWRLAGVGGGKAFSGSDS